MYKIQTHMPPPPLPSGIIPYNSGEAERRRRRRRKGRSWGGGGGAGEELGRRGRREEVPASQVHKVDGLLIIYLGLQNKQT